VLVPTPPDKVCDPDERLYWAGLLLRQANPDDAIVIAARDAIAAAVPGLRGRLGAQEALWVRLTERRLGKMNPTLVAGARKGAFSRPRTRRRTRSRVVTPSGRRPRGRAQGVPSRGGARRGCAGWPAG